MFAEADDPPPTLNRCTRQRAEGHIVRHTTLDAGQALAVYILHPRADAPGSNRQMTS